MADISLRDYFAAKALQGFVAIPNTVYAGGADQVADKAYRYADAMLAARGAGATEAAADPADDDWTMWHGGICPVPGKTVVDVRFLGGGVSMGKAAGLLRWDHQFNGSGGDIIAYRVRQEGGAQ